MANFTGAERTNYFKVKNRRAFLAWASKNKFEVIKSGRTRLGLLPGEYTDDGIFDCFNPETCEEFDLAEELAKHLAPGSVAVIMGSGAEKLRYVSGWARAVNHRGDEVSVNLADIYNLAHKKFGVRPTEASY